MQFRAVQANEEDLLVWDFISRQSQGTDVDQELAEKELEFSGQRIQE